MKYLLFAGESYEAKGGFYDLRGSFDTPNAAQRGLRAIPEFVADFWWAHVVTVDGDDTKLISVYDGDGEWDEA